MSAREEAIGRLAKVADDWGWKGGKPGEVTGGDYHGALDDLYYRMNSFESDPDAVGFEYERQLARWRNAEDDLREELDQKIIDQIESSKNNQLKNAFIKSGEDIEKFTQDMKTLERANIPREWTGKVWPVIQGQLQKQFDYIPPILAQQVSDLMRPMTNDQRYMFLKLMSSNISGQTLDRIASTVRRITKS